MTEERTNPPPRRVIVVLAEDGRTVLAGIAADVEVGNLLELARAAGHKRVILEEIELGPQAVLCRISPCAVRGCKFRGQCEAHHYPSRGAGGLDADTLPLCPDHHDEVHRIGAKSFEVKYGVSLVEERERMRELSS